jgi:hypothetical protein
MLSFGHWYLPFDLAQGGKLVEPFGIWYLVFGISMILFNKIIYVIPASYLFI